MPSAPQPTSGRRFRAGRIHPIGLGLAIVVALVIGVFVGLGIAGQRSIAIDVESVAPPVGGTAQRPALLAAHPLVKAGIMSLDHGEWRIDTAAVVEMLDRTAVTNVSATGYTADSFEFWTDPDGNGCDTRNEVLARDLMDVVLDDDGCTVLSGILQDPYTGTVIDFKRGVETSGAVQIDHVVARSSAWTGGANAWTDIERELFANDPVGLLAVDGPTNQAKRDFGPSEWLPLGTVAQCRFVAQYALVLDRYGLATTQPDLDAMRDVIAGC